MRPDRQTSSLPSVPRPVEEELVPDQATVPSSNTAGGRPAPTPSGEPLTVKIRCWASQAPRPKTVKHTITIHPDWRVEVPHELDAERRAQYR